VRTLLCLGRCTWDAVLLNCTTSWPSTKWRGRLSSCVPLNDKMPCLRCCPPHGLLLRCGGPCPLPRYRTDPCQPQIHQARPKNDGHKLGCRVQGCPITIPYTMIWKVWCAYSLYVGLARTVNIHRIWPYIWWCSKNTVCTPDRVCGSGQPYLYEWRGKEFCTGSTCTNTHKGNVY
jgi:hypothetical protein